MKEHQKTIGKNDEWLTPIGIVQALGDFDLDPCAPIARPWDTAECHYTIVDDGLKLPWSGRVWLNPPFNRYERPRWMEKAAQHGNTIMLIPAATETKAFFDHVWSKADAVLFVEGRPHFHYIDGSRAKANCGTAIVLVAYGADNAKRLADSGLGRFISLNAPGGSHGASSGCNQPDCPDASSRQGNSASHPGHSGDAKRRRNAEDRHGVEAKPQRNCPDLTCYASMNFNN